MTARNLVVTTHDVAGADVEGARVWAVLVPPWAKALCSDGEGVIVKTRSDTETTDASGQATLSLEPNATLRPAGSMWDVHIEIDGETHVERVSTIDENDTLRDAIQRAQDNVPVVVPVGGLPDGSVGTRQIVDRAVTLAKMADGTAGKVIGYNAQGEPAEVDATSVAVSHTAPANPSQGDLWYDSSNDDRILKVRVGAQWVRSGYAAVRLSDRSNPQTGDILSRDADGTYTGKAFLTLVAAAQPALDQRYIERSELTEPADALFMADGDTVAIVQASESAEFIITDSSGNKLSNWNNTGFDWGTVPAAGRLYLSPKTSREQDQFHTPGALIDTPDLAVLTTWTLHPVAPHTDTGGSLELAISRKVGTGNTAYYEFTARQLTGNMRSDSSTWRLSTVDRATFRIPADLVFPRLGAGAFGDRVPDGLPKFTVSDSAPSGPSNGDYWYDTRSDRDFLKVRVNNAWKRASSFSSTYQADLDSLIALEPDIEAVIAIVLSESVTRTFVSGNLGSNGNAKLTDPTGEPSPIDKELAVNIDSDSEVGNIGLGEWVRVTQGSSYLIFQVLDARDDAGNDARLLFYDDSDAVKSGSISAGSATIEFSRNRIHADDVEGLSDEYARLDGSNIDAEFRDIVQGDTERVSLGNSTRVANIGVLSAAGQFRFVADPSIDSTTGFSIRYTDDYYTLALDRWTTGDYIEVGAGVFKIASQPQSLGNNTLQANVTMVRGTVTAVNASAAIEGYGQDVERSELKDGLLVGETDPWLPSSQGFTTRGQKIATFALPTSSTSGSITPTSRTFDAGAPSGFASFGTRSMTVPPLRPSDAVNGIWAVAVEGTTKRAEALMPWGPSGLETESATEDQAYASLHFDDNEKIDVRYVHGDAGGYINLWGDGDTLPGDAKVEFYLAGIFLA